MKVRPIQFVPDVADAVRSYEALGLTADAGDLRLVLSAPAGDPGGGAPMPDGTRPRPGGWSAVRSRSRR
jgi:hypothetical protein